MLGWKKVQLILELFLFARLRSNWIYKYKNSLDSNLQVQSKCSIGILSINRDMFKKPTCWKSNQFNKSIRLWLRLHPSRISTRHDQVYLRLCITIFSRKIWIPAKTARSSIWPGFYHSRFVLWSQTCRYDEVG